MNRKPIFDAAKKLGAVFDNADDVRLMDSAIDEAMREAVATVPAPRPSQGLGRRVSKRAVDHLHRWEGLAKKRPDGLIESYPDPGSKDGKPWTIGYGSTGADIGPGTVWTVAQCDARFIKTLSMFEDGVTRLIGSSATSQDQFDALVCIAYNIGLDEDADTIAEGLGDSTLLRKHKAGDYEGAAKAFLSWRFNDGREMKGLKNRREAEAKIYRGEAA